MKTNPLLAATALAAALLAAGCQTAPSGGARPGPDGMSRDKDIQKVWRADGFDFRGYDALVIRDVQATAAPHNAEEVPLLAWARTFLRDETAAAIRTNGLFATVLAGDAAPPAGSRALVLETTITGYEKGGGAARYWAGIYGAGQPKLRVAGVAREGDREVFRFEASRSGESGSARMFGGFRSDQDIQREDIVDLAHDLSDYMHRTARGTKP